MEDNRFILVQKQNRMQIFVILDRQNSEIDNREHLAGKTNGMTLLQCNYYQTNYVKLPRMPLLVTLNAKFDWKNI